MSCFLLQLAEPAFDQLRTKEQLGYIVHTSLKRFAQNVLGISFIVQSSHKEPIYLDGRVEDFLVNYRQELESMSEEKLQTYIRAVCEKLLEKPKNLDQESSKYWVEIRNNTYLFNRKELLVEMLKDSSLNVKSLLEFFDRYLNSSSNKRSKLSSQFFGKDYALPEDAATTTENGNKKVVKISDPSLFKRTFPLLPVESYEV